MRHTALASLNIGQAGEGGIKHVYTKGYPSNNRQLHIICQFEGNKEAKATIGQFKEIRRQYIITDKWSYVKVGGGLPHETPSERPARAGWVARSY